MTLQTEHCLLRPLSAADQHLVYQLDSLPEVVRYISQPFSEEASKQHLQQMLMYSKMYNNQLGFWIVELKATGQGIGWFALKHLDLTQEIEIGARLLPEHQNKHYALQITNELLQYAWRLGLRRLSAVTHPDNIPPQRVLLQLGFQFVKKAVFYDQELHYFQKQADSQR